MNVLASLEKSYKLPDAPPEIIKAVQTQLVKVELLDGLVDGIAGKQTLSAFARFKQLEYLEYPDLLGRSTAQALLEATYTRDAPVDHARPASAIHKALLPKVGFVNSNDRIHLGGHFTWGEFTKELSRVPQNVKIVDNIFRLADYLEDVRKLFGNSTILITSGYRPPAVNASPAVKGASNSQHLYGAAADIIVGGFNPHEVFKRLDSWHGSKGGLGNSSGFTHIDLRGYRARWAYGNA